MEYKFDQGNKIWCPWYKANVDIINNILVIDIYITHIFLYFRWINSHHDDIPNFILEVINVEI